MTQMQAVGTLLVLALLTITVVGQSVDDDDSNLRNVDFVHGTSIKSANDINVNGLSRAKALAHSLQYKSASEK